MREPQPCRRSVETQTVGQTWMRRLVLKSNRTRGTSSGSHSINRLFLPFAGQIGQGRSLQRRQSFQAAQKPRSLGLRCLGVLTRLPSATATKETQTARKARSTIGSEMTQSNLKLSTPFFLHFLASSHKKHNQKCRQTTICKRRVRFVLRRAPCPIV